MLPFLFSAYTMEAVGKAAMSIVHEVRRQFQNIKGLMEGKAKPDYSSCVSICTGESVKLMLIPAAVSIVTPVLVSATLGVSGTAGLKAAVVGDTVGDPFKDTSGPSINILIKLTSMVAIVFLGLALLSNWV